jgi:hypothetical protein
MLFKMIPLGMILEFRFTSLEFSVGSLRAAILRGQLYML